MPAPPWKRWMAWLGVMCLSAVIIAVPISGCSSGQEVAAERQKQTDAKAALEARATAAESVLAQLNPVVTDLTAKQAALTTAIHGLQSGSAERMALESAAAGLAGQVADAARSADALKTAAADARAKAADIGVRIAKADAITTEAANPTNPGTTIGGLASVFVPGLGVALAPILGLFWRGVRLGQAKNAMEDKANAGATALDNVVSSIEALAHVSPAVAQAIKDHAPLLDVVQGPIGKAAVDAVQNGSIFKINLAAPPAVAA